MQEIVSKDPSIKLFGKKITLPADVDSPSTSSQSYHEEEEQITDKDCSVENASEYPQEVDPPAANCHELADRETDIDTNVNPQTPSTSEESANLKASKSEKEHNDATSLQEKMTLKKPDKILPCPRCNSMDTKFCYYNNYNANQPRHLCKACQRYWTAGGNMRNVPVGSGRRKNKNSASYYRHITISEALQAARFVVPNGTQHPMLKSNGRVLNFGINSPISDKKLLNGTQDHFRILDEQRFAVPSKGENGDSCSNGSSLTVSHSIEGGKTCSQETVIPSVNCFASRIPCLSSVPWPYPWNSALPPMSPPAFCPPGFPLSFCPSAYWNCGVTGAWSANVSLSSPQSSSSSSSVNQKTTWYNQPPPTVGKHSRDSEKTTPDGSEKEEPPTKKNGCVLVPKTLRIDDPSEAAKSSIWTTLGIKNQIISGKSLFKAFQPKTHEKNHLTQTSLVLQANPAALSRSVNFHESS